MSPLDEAFAQTASAPQPAFEPHHLPVVALVIVAEEVQQSMEREHAQFGLFAVASLARLPGRDATRNHDVA